MIELSQVSKSYRGTAALRQVDLRLPRGEIVGLFGENGAGKTTLMKCILNLLRYKGTITLDGEPITHRNIASLSFATSEHSFFPDLTPNAHMTFYQEHFPQFSQRRFKGLMEFFSLPAHQPLRRMSAGQKNQFEVILALSQGRTTSFWMNPSPATTCSTGRTSTRCCWGSWSPGKPCSSPPT